MKSVREVVQRTITVFQILNDHSLPQQEAFLARQRQATEIQKNSVVYSCAADLRHLHLAVNALKSKKMRVSTKAGAEYIYFTPFDRSRTTTAFDRYHLHPLKRYL